MLINENILQNVVYKVKMSVGSVHSWYNDLPFYWYCDGLVNDLLSDSFLDLKKYLESVGDYYSLRDDYVDNHGFGTADIDSDVSCIVDTLISKGDYVYDGLVEDIYKDFAPLKVVYPFKYKIFNTSLNDEFTLDGDEFVRSFSDCQWDFPPIKYLDDYNLIFNKFARRIDILNDDNLIAEKWDIIKELIKNLWFTFAYGLRCLEHDSYYDKYYDEWDLIFKNSVSQLNSEINHFRSKSRNWIDYSKYGELTEEEKSFIAPLIDIILEDCYDG